MDFGTITGPGLASIVIRSVIVYVAILAALRLAGKRHVAQLSLLDFVLVLLVSNAVQTAMVGSDVSLAGGLVAATALILLNVALTKFLYRHEALGALLEGQPRILILNGEILEDHLRREGIRPNELQAAIREHGFEDASKVKLAILEIDGSISVLAYEAAGRERRIPPVSSHRRGGRRGLRPGQT